ncbi:MAG: hypothetical protein ACFE0J_15100 [Elainellaceae cyanobacterium]
MASSSASTSTNASSSAKHSKANYFPDLDAQLEALAPDADPTDTKVQSLAVLWARKYYMSVMSRKDSEQSKHLPSLEEATSQRGRRITSEKLLKNLSLASGQAWSMTEQLLAEEIHAHEINSAFIDPIHIADDSRRLFEKALTAYANGLSPRRLSVLIGGESGRIRQKYTAQDPRVIGFVSIQFHYTGKILLSYLSAAERFLFEPYIKVMDDHMYMPLRDAYQAAANYSLGSPTLVAVQHLLPISSEIARAVCTKVSRINPTYESYSGALNSDVVRTSSIRDVEMFQVYLCLCVLEDSIRSVQCELFPLCVMLYPALKVKWKLVQDMLQALTWEMVDRLDSEDMSVFIPYLRLLADMFSKEVFQNPATF